MRSLSRSASKFLNVWHSDTKVRFLDTSTLYKTSTARMPICTSVTLLVVSTEAAKATQPAQELSTRTDLPPLNSAIVKLAKSAWEGEADVTKRFTEEQIIAVMKEAEAGAKVRALTVGFAPRRGARRENATPKRIVPDQTLDPSIVPSRPNLLYHPYDQGRNSIISGGSVRRVPE